MSRQLTQEFIELKQRVYAVEELHQKCKDIDEALSSIREHGVKCSLKEQAPYRSFSETIEPGSLTHEVLVKDLSEKQAKLLHRLQRALDTVYADEFSEKELGSSIRFYGLDPQNGISVND